METSETAGTEMRINEFDRLLDGLEYPVSSEAIVEEYGDRELSLQGGAETVEEVFTRCGPEWFADPDEVRMTLHGSLCEDAVGRKGYSDRDPPSRDEAEHVSL